MRNMLTRASETMFEKPLSSNTGPRTTRKPALAPRQQQLASDRIRDKIRRAKLELQRQTAPSTAAEPQAGETPRIETAMIAATAVATSAATATKQALTIVFKPAGSRTKRAFDIVGATLCLIALAPIMLALAFMVRRDGGPAIFGHRRIGSNGETFRCLKFRSMCIDAERRLQDHLANNPEARAEWEKDFKLRDDPRITPLGHILRRTSLDELPQLFNVLRGEMSLVGPRPIVADEVERYGDRFEAYRNCRPGITGLWQVSGRNDISYRSRVRLDSFYATRWSMAKDIFILVRTVSVVLRRSGAY